MHRDQLPIAEPCAADWGAMTGDDRQRFCDHCTKPVHDLSAMTAPEAIALLAEASKPCVRYAVDADGGVVHRAEPTPARRSGRRSRMLAMAAALAASVPALAAPAAAPDADRPAWATWIRDRWQAFVGAEATPEAPPEQPWVMGEVALPPPPPPPPPTVMGRIALPDHPSPPVSPTVPPAELPPPPPGEMVIPEVQAVIDAQRTRR